MGGGGGITTLLHKFTISIYYRKKPVLRNIAWHYYVLEIKHSFSLTIEMQDKI